MSNTTQAAYGVQRIDIEDPMIIVANANGVNLAALPDDTRQLLDSIGAAVDRVSGKNDATYTPAGNTDERLKRLATLPEGARGIIRFLDESPLLNRITSRN